MQRYFIDKKQINHNNIIITDNDFHHIKNVMRMKIGQEIICCDQEKMYLTKIKNINSKIELDIIKILEENNELKVDVTIAHGLVRREKTEEVIRRLTELGCYQYIPISMQRSIVKSRDDKFDRWHKIIKEASEQSHRHRLMKISETMSLKQLISQKHQFQLCLFAHLTPHRISLKQAINGFNSSNILIVIGPEGGFEDKEVQLLTENGFIPISLGNRVLRTETAPLYAMSVLAYETGEQDES